MCSSVLRMEITVVRNNIYTCNSSTQDVEAQEPQVQGYPKLHKTTSTNKNKKVANNKLPHGFLSQGTLTIKGEGHIKN